MNLSVLEVLAGFIYCLQENGPKKVSSCFEEFMVLNAPTPNSVRAENNNSYSDKKKTPHIVMMMTMMITIIITTTTTTTIIIIIIIITIIIT